MTVIDPPANGGETGYAKTVLDILMGEPSALADANDDIRDAIAAAKVATTSLDLSSL